MPLDLGRPPDLLFPGRGNKLETTEAAVKFQDSSLPVEHRVDDLLARMALED
jgi:hypothetical protein